MRKEHINLLKQTDSEPNPKYTIFNREEKWTGYYQLLVVDKDGHIAKEDTKYYELPV